MLSFRFRVIVDVCGVFSLFFNFFRGDENSILCNVNFCLNVFKKCFGNIKNAKKTEKKEER